MGGKSLSVQIIQNYLCGGFFAFSPFLLIVWLSMIDLFIRGTHVNKQNNNVFTFFVFVFAFFVFFAFLSKASVNNLRCRTISIYSIFINRNVFKEIIYIGI